VNTKTPPTTPPNNTKIPETITDTLKTANKKPSSPTSTQLSLPANPPQSTFLKPFSLSKNPAAECSGLPSIRRNLQVEKNNHHSLEPNSKKIASSKNLLPHKVK
jgi:hypothetical protein